MLAHNTHLLRCSQVRCVRPSSEYNFLYWCVTMPMGWVSDIIKTKCQLFTDLAQTV